MQGGDRGLRLVFAQPVAGQRGLQNRHPLGDQAGVPARSVLLTKRYQAASRASARSATRIVQQHEREQPRDLRLVGQGDELAGETDRLGRQVNVSAVSLVEDEVEQP